MAHQVQDLQYNPLVQQVPGKVTIMLMYDDALSDHHTGTVTYGFSNISFISKLSKQPSWSIVTLHQEEYI